MEKIKTFSLNQEGGCALIDTEINNIIDVLKIELTESELEDDDDVIEFVIRIEKTHTQKELEELGDWDGF